MDFVSIGFYACICGLLGVFAPHLRTPAIRLGVGAVVGVIAALVLPVLKGTMMGY